MTAKMKMIDVIIPTVRNILNKSVPICAIWLSSVWFLTTRTGMMKPKATPN